MYVCCKMRSSTKMMMSKLSMAKSKTLSFLPSSLALPSCCSKIKVDLSSGVCWITNVLSLYFFSFSFFLLFVVVVVFETLRPFEAESLEDDLEEGLGFIEFSNPFTGWCFVDWGFGYSWLKGTWIMTMLYCGGGKSFTLSHSGRQCSGSKFKWPQIRTYKLSPLLFIMIDVFISLD